MSGLGLISECVSEGGERYDDLKTVPPEAQKQPEKPVTPDRRRLGEQDSNPIAIPSSSTGMAGKRLKNGWCRLSHTSSLEINDSIRESRSAAAYHIEM